LACFVEVAGMIESFYGALPAHAGNATWLKL
jgi:hypothetical protein